MAKASQHLPDFSFEAQHPSPVAGVDEAGRGPWAGPVVAAAVILQPERCPTGLNDSKKLSALRRDALFDELRNSADLGIGIAEVAEIDRLNIARATDLAMCRAVQALPRQAAFCLIDGRSIPQALSEPALAIIKGDGRSMSIAAASIVAKVTRDRIMIELAKEFPGYGWERNKGYGVAAHHRAMAELGITPHHRRSFRPVHNMLVEDSALRP